MLMIAFFLRSLFMIFFFAVFFSFIFFTLIFLIMLVSYFEKKKLVSSFEYPIVVLLAVLGMLCLLCSHDMFFIFLGIELQSFCLYALSAYRSDRAFLQSEAGLKYFVFGALASSLYLFALSLLYLIFGTLNLDSIIALSYFDLPLNLYYTLNFSILLIFFALFFKLGIAPFHSWLPQVYSFSAPMLLSYL